MYIQKKKKERNREMRDLKNFKIRYFRKPYTCKRNNYISFLANRRFLFCVSVGSRIPLLAYGALKCVHTCDKHEKRQFLFCHSMRSLYEKLALETAIAARKRGYVTGRLLENRYFQGAIVDCSRSGL